MKFYAEPGHLALFSKHNKKVMNSTGFRFDENGVYETDDKRLIPHLIKLFSTIPLDEARKIKAKEEEKIRLSKEIWEACKELDQSIKTSKDMNKEIINLEVLIENKEIELEELRNKLEEIEKAEEAEEVEEVEVKVKVGKR